MISLVSLFSFSKVSAAESYANDRLERIQVNQILRVCIWPEYYTITYHNPRTNVLEGIDIDMAKALAMQLNVEVEFIDSSFAQLVENLRDDRCDIAMHGVGVRDDRAKFMDFSQPHLRSGIYAVSRINNTHINTWEDIDQRGNIVAVQRGTYMEPVMREYLVYAELLVVDNFLAREQEVLAGRADVFMTDYPYGLRMADLTNWAKLITPTKPFALTDYAYAVPLNEPSWLATVNQFVTDMKADGTLQSYAIKHGLEAIVVLD
ncbi:MAG: amino acid ABC transporter substrate-binding protein [Oceanospirillales bacterium]|nr:MAG: amino acid ABC transporter substrate-binding protein [Oceanospirillales bacterium]